MPAFLQSLGSVGFAEIGDKTQLLSFLLAIRLRRPVPILCGILLANLVNHALSVELGEVLGAALTSAAQRWVLGLAFAAMAVWALIPDRLQDDTRVTFANARRLEAFIITLVSYVLAEIGDRTQVAAVVLGARFEAFLPVVLGTTLGASLADVPVVLGGCWAGRCYAPSWTRYVAAAIFCLQAVFVLSEVSGR